MLPFAMTYFIAKWHFLWQGDFVVARDFLGGCGDNFFILCMYREIGYNLAKKIVIESV